MVNKQGYLSIEHGEAGMEKIIQKQLLEAEGVKVEEDFTVNMHDYFWKQNKWIPTIVRSNIFPTSFSACASCSSTEY